MSDSVPFRARLSLKLYDWLGRLLYLFSGFVLWRRSLKGKEDFSRRGERYGYATYHRPSGPVIWLHGASVGESLALLPLVERINGFKINVVFTTGTVASAKILSDRLSGSCVHQYVPLDIRGPVDRFLNHWSPDLAIFAESELWPMMVMELSKRQIPQLLVNARISDHSLIRWRHRPALSNFLFSRLTQVIAQSDLDGERFTSLGAPWVIVGGNLKADVPPAPVDRHSLFELQNQIGNRPVWIAASTHGDEELSIAHVHSMLRAHIPNLLTVIVPRHSDRSKTIVKSLITRGLDVATRSSGELITDATDIFLGDTMGEMGLYLRLGSIVFLGKSLYFPNTRQDRKRMFYGGQNPLEPAMIGMAILSGRYVQNFRAIYETMINAGGVRLVDDENNLAAHILYLFQHPDHLASMRHASSSSLHSMKGSLQRTSDALDRYLLPLRVKANLQSAASDL